MEPFQKVRLGVLYKKLPDSRLGRSIGFWNTL